MATRKRISALALAVACFLAAATGSAGAAGAFAVGACGAYGYGYGFHTIPAARLAAMRKCSGKHCHVVGIFHRGCAALSIDAKNVCGPFGWAIESHLGRAENVSMHRCYQYGGRECVVRAWACDDKG